MFVPISVPLKFVVDQPKNYHSVRNLFRSLEKAKDYNEIALQCEALRTVLNQIFDIYNDDIEKVAQFVSLQFPVQTKELMIQVSATQKTSNTVEKPIDKIKVEALSVELRKRWLNLIIPENIKFLQENKIHPYLLQASLVISAPQQTPDYSFVVT